MDLAEATAANAVYAAHRARHPLRLTSAAAPRRPVALDAAPPRLRPIAPVRPSAALEVTYRRRLTDLVDGMARSVRYWLAAAYRANEPEMAMDKSPARALADRVRSLRRRWERNFARLADDLARHFARSVASRSDLALRRSLARGGMSVEFKMTSRMNDVLQAIVQENVSLIRSIPSNYFAQVEGIVQRSVQAGRDLHRLSEDLQHQFGVTKRRAALISRDQNNKATASLTRVRYQELGIERMRWLHSGGGKEPRPSHVQASRDRVTFDLREGWFDPHEKKYILPGQLVNCRCSMVPVLEKAA